jgi:sugar phosphate isomerase/epimerase
MVKALIQPTAETYTEYLHFANERDLGFEIIDFALPAVINSEYENVIKHYESRPEGEKRLFISQHGAALDIYINSRDKLIREVSEKRIHNNLEISERLKLPFTVFHSGFIPLIGQKSYYENWVKSHVEFWSDANKHFKTSILLENLWDPSPDNLKEVMDQLNPNSANVCFDTGHHNIFSKATLREWFKALGKRIPYIHMNDNLGDVDSELPAGKGSVNWLEFNDVVNEFCDKPIVVFEVSSLENIAHSIYFLEKNRIYPYN